MNQSELLQIGLGRTMTFFGRAGYMVSLSLDSQQAGQPSCEIHIDSPTSIFLHGKVYTTTAEIDDEIPYGLCEYDKKLGLLMDSGRKYILTNISYDQDYLLHLSFSNGLKIRSYSVEAPDAEMWRIFLRHTDDPHMVAYPTGIEME